MRLTAHRPQATTQDSPICFPQASPRGPPGLCACVLNYKELCWMTFNKNVLSFNSLFCTMSYMLSGVASLVFLVWFSVSLSLGNSAYLHEEKHNGVRNNMGSRVQFCSKRLKSRVEECRRQTTM